MKQNIDGHYVMVQKRDRGGESGSPLNFYADSINSVESGAWS